MKPDAARIIKDGYWLYNGTTRCRIVITREDFFPGTGDCEDPPTDRDDNHAPCVKIWFDNPAQKNDFYASRYAHSVEEALSDLSRLISGMIEWTK